MTQRLIYRHIYSTWLNYCTNIQLWGHQHSIQCQVSLSHDVSCNILNQLLGSGNLRSWWSPQTLHSPSFGLVSRGAFLGDVTSPEAAASTNPSTMVARCMVQRSRFYARSVAWNKHQQSAFPLHHAYVPTTHTIRTYLITPIHALFSNSHSEFTEVLLQFIFKVQQICHWIQCLRGLPRHHNTQYSEIRSWRFKDQFLVKVNGSCLKNSHASLQVCHLLSNVE